MPRPKTLRKIVKPPDFKGFRPYGVSGHLSGKVDLLYEEYEALKLADYDLMNQLEASKMMGVSRPTFARIYDSAEEKWHRHLYKLKKLKLFTEKLFSTKTGGYAINAMPGLPCRKMLITVGVRFVRQRMYILLALNSKSVTSGRNSKPGTRNPELKTQNPEPGTQNSEPGTQNIQQ